MNNRLESSFLKNKNKNKYKNFLKNKIKISSVRYFIII